jgi:hypothetical protein
MAIENHVFLLNTTDNMDISVGNYYCLWIVGKVLEVVELLDFIGFIFDVEEIAMCFFDRENGNLLDFLL